MSLRVCTSAATAFALSTAWLLSACDTSDAGADGGNAGKGGAAAQAGASAAGGAAAGLSGSGGADNSLAGAGNGGAAGSFGAGGGAGTDSGVPGPWPPASTFANPVSWLDLPDIDVLRVGDAFYYSASTFAFSPGAPILRSYDLVNWEFVGHSVPTLSFGAKYDMNGAYGYVRGIWASTLGYRASNSTWYWIGCIDFARTYVFTAGQVEGPWEQSATIANCYYDAGLLVDDDDKMYVAYGNGEISVAELSADGLSQVRTQRVFTKPAEISALEGARFYKIDGDYYITLTRPPDGQYVLRSTSGPFGPYTLRPLIDRVRSPVAGGGAPHQGGFVQLQNGDWYYLGFSDAYPGGRIPVLAPLTFDSDGFPRVELVDGGWGASYPYPDVPRPPRLTKPHTGVDNFEGERLGHEWEWNHNPDNTKWSAGGQLTFQTATVTNDLYRARNTLTRRILGPSSTATIELDYSAMREGDHAGLALFRDRSASIGVKRGRDGARVVMVSGVNMDASWNTTSIGTESASEAVSGGRIWLRVSVDIRPGANRQGRFSFSTDGTEFTPLGAPLTLTNDWRFFMGYRFAIFNFATQNLGGKITVDSFALTTP